MKVIANLCLIPMGVEASISSYITEINKILKSENSLHCEMHANGTNIEGELSEITQAVEKCYGKLFEMGVPRTYTTLTFSARQDKEQNMNDKLKSVGD